MRAVELHDARAWEAQQPADLLGDLLEHAARRRLTGDERGDPAQCRLLVGERPLRRLACRQARAARVRSAVTAARTAT